MVDDEEKSADTKGDESRVNDTDGESFSWVNTEGESDEPSSQQSTDPTAGRTRRLWHTGEMEDGESDEPSGQQNSSPTNSQQDDSQADKQNSVPQKGGQVESDRGSSLQDSTDIDPETHDQSSPTESSFADLIEQSGASNSSDQSRRRYAGAEDADASTDEVAELFNDLNAFDRAMAGSQILVLSPTNHSITDSICSEFVTVGGAAGRDVMSVTTTQSPAKRLEIIQNTPEWSGGQVAVIEVGDLATSDPIDDESVVHKRISNPKKLQKLGLVITQTLKGWSGRDRPATLCFHTISEIGHHVQNQTLFQFLYTLQAKLNSMGMTAHYHMDPAEHDEQDPDTFKSMFDFVLRVSQDGSIEVE